MRVDLVVKGEVIKFPCLMINRETNVIIYATERRGSNIWGVVIATLKSKASYNEGCHGFFVANGFTQYDGTVSLTND